MSCRPLHSAAGDVSEILENLVSVKAEWENIMTFLKVSNGEIQSIKQQRFHQQNLCLADGLTYWLQGNTKKTKNAPTINWRSLLDALRSGLVKKPALADQLEREFRKSIS